MKKLLFLAICNLIFFTSIAQQWRLVEIVEDRLPQKIITYKYYYDYSKDRGSSKMADTIFYDSFKVFVADANGLRQEPFTCVNKYDNNNNLILKTIHTDTGKFSEERMVYNTKDQLTDWYSCKTMYSPNLVYACASEAHNTYDAQDRLAATVYNYGAVLPDSADYRMVYTYDGNSNLIMDSAYLLNPMGSNVRVYKHHYIYDINNNLIRMIEIEIQSSTAYFDTIAVETHTYNAQGKLESTDLQNKLSNPVFNTINYKYYPDGNLMSVGLNYYEYTSFGKLSLHIYGDTGRPNPPVTNRYYYEHYWPAGIDKDVTINNELVVYPIPASGLVNITAYFDAAIDITATLTDVQGRVLRSWTETAVHDYRKQLPVSGLAAGNYFITINTGTTRMVRQFVVQ